MHEMGKNILWNKQVCQAGSVRLALGSVARSRTPLARQASGCTISAAHRRPSGTKQDTGRAQARPSALVIWAASATWKEPRERARKKVGLLSPHPAACDWRSLFDRRPRFSGMSGNIRRFPGDSVTSPGQRQIVELLDLLVILVRMMTVCL